MIARLTSGIEADEDDDLTVTAWFLHILSHSRFALDSHLTLQTPCLILDTSSITVAAFPSDPVT